MKLGKQLFLIFGIATLIPMAVLWFWLENEMHQQKVSEVHERHLLIAKNLTTALDRYHTDVRTGFEVVTENLNRSQKLAGINKIVNNLNFRHFCIADLVTGKVIESAGPENAPCPLTVPPKRLKYFKNLVENQSN